VCKQYTGGYVNVSVQLGTSEGSREPGEGARHGVLILSVTSREDLWRTGLAEEEVDHVEETAEAVAVPLASRDEDDRDIGGNTDGVLSVEVLVIRIVSTERRQSRGGSRLTASIPASASV
jgi:hypothetical protein